MSLDATTAVASVKGGGGSYLPKTEAGDGQGDGRSAEPGALLGAGRRELGGTRPSRAVGAQRREGLDVRLAGHARRCRRARRAARPGAREVTLSGTAALRRDETWSLPTCSVASEARHLRLVAAAAMARPASSTFLSSCAQLSRRCAPGLAGDHRPRPRPSSCAPTARPAAASRPAATVAGQPLSLAGRFDARRSGRHRRAELRGPLGECRAGCHRSCRHAGIARRAARSLKVDAAPGCRRRSLARRWPARSTPRSPPIRSLRRDGCRRASRGTGLRSGAIGVGTLQLDATIDDPMGAAAADATISGQRPERRSRYRPRSTPR